MSLLYRVIPLKIFNKTWYINIKYHLVVQVLYTCCLYVTYLTYKWHNKNINYCMSFRISQQSVRLKKEANNNIFLLISRSAMLKSCVLWCIERLIKWNEYLNANLIDSVWQGAHTLYVFLLFISGSNMRQKILSN